MKTGVAALPSVRALGAAFVTWWIAELRALWSSTLRPLMPRRRNVLTLDTSDEQWNLQFRKGAHMLELGSVDHGTGHGQSITAILPKGTQARNTALRVLVAPDKALRKLLDMPSATEPDLRQALYFEIDRHTPFRPDDVYFDYRVVARRPQSKRVTVELTIVPRQVVDAILNHVHGWGFRPSIVDLASSEAQDGIGINLLRGLEEEHISPGLSRPMMAYAIVLLALLAGAIYVPLNQLAAIDQSLLAQVAEEKDKAQQIMAMRDELDQAVRAAGFLDERKNNVSGVLRVINDLTRTLPDHTWLTSLSRHDNQMRIAGASAAASELVSLLEDVPLFQNPAFPSPIMQDPHDKLEHFEMSFELVEKKEP